MIEREKINDDGASYYQNITSTTYPNIILNLHEPERYSIMKEA